MVQNQSATSMGWVSICLLANTV